MDDDRVPRPDPLDRLSRNPAVRIIQADVNIRAFPPRWGHPTSFIDLEPVEALEQTGYEERRPVQRVVLADALYSRPAFAPTSAGRGIGTRRGGSLAFLGPEENGM